MKRYIWITTQKEGIHNYPNAPEGVEYLRHPHRHVFYFRVKVEVTHNNRDIEFILFKHQVEKYLNEYMLNFTSCEAMAEQLGRYITLKYPNRDLIVSVSEDNENGAEIHFWDE